MALVSVIIPCHNSFKFVDDAIDSVLNQTFDDWEIIAVDDGSTDETLQHLTFRASALSSKMRVVSQKNRGAAAARNAGIKVASGRFVAFLDSDDIWHPRKIEHQVEYLRVNQHVRGVSTSYRFITGAAQRQFGTRTFRWSSNELHDWILLGRSAPALCSTLMVRRHYITAGSGFDELLGSHAEDLDLAWRLFTAGRFDSLVRCLAYIRKSPKGGHTNTGEMLNSLGKFHQKSQSSEPRVFLLASMNLRIYLRFRLARETKSWSSLFSAFSAEPLSSIRFLTFRFVSLLFGLARDFIRPAFLNFHLASLRHDRRGK